MMQPKYTLSGSMMMQWRLGIDLGTNSLGWWAFAVQKQNKRWEVTDSIDGGVYIFSDGREPSEKGRVGESKAVARRFARGVRRNRDRSKVRLRALMRELLHLNLMPKEASERQGLFQSKRYDPDPEKNNPYRLRTEALSRPLQREELGRVLFHLALRRGFKSNRIEASDDDGGKLKERIEALNEKLSGRTLGQFIWDAYQQEKSNQGRHKNAAGIRFRGDSELYPDRFMYETEFNAIRANQEKHHALTAEDWDKIRDRYILFQWPLKPVERGACTFFPHCQRHWKDTPIGHDFRIYQELNSLRWIDENHAEHSLDPEQRRAVLSLLLTRKSEVQFKSLRKEKRADVSVLFPECVRFNLEDEKRKGLKPHRFAAAFSSDPILAALWEARESDAGDDGRLDDIFEILLKESDSAVLTKCLREDFSLDSDVVTALSGLKLSRVTANVSRAFMDSVVPVLRDQGLLYWEAVGEIKNADGTPLDFTLKPSEGDEDKLPYYGEVLQGSMLGADPTANSLTDPEKHFGRINNPTVHVALNALRRVTNTLIERFGTAPVAIHVELSRDLKKTKKIRDEQLKQQAANQRENDRIRALLVAHGIANPSAMDIKKVKLWEELGENELARCCPFTSKPISFAQLMNGDVEIEHILPFKRTLDDSMANLTVAFRRANRLKGNKTPYEAFADNRFEKDGVVWDQVRARGEALHRKSWRFGPDAMTRFENDSDFIARQLTDNAHIAKAAVKYLGCLRGVEQVVPNRGGLTALLRGKWHLNGILSDDNFKSRADHRHHAVDAAVIALADRSVLQSVSSLTARGADDRLHIDVPDLDKDIEKALRDRVPQIVVAHKPDHGWQAPMFKETAYGFVPEERRDPDLPEHNLVVRKPLMNLTPKEHGVIRDPILREQVLACIDKAKAENQKPEKALADFAKASGVNKTRILVKDQTVKPVGSAGYKGHKPDSYVCCDVWRCPKGKPGKWKANQFEWTGVYWAYAETPNGVPEAQTRKPHPSAKFVARLYKDDLIAYEEAGTWKIMRVAGFSTTNNRLDVRPHNLSESSQTFSGVNVLGKQGLRKLRVEPDGCVRGLPLARLS
ncbi:MAG: HNH endonuclease domain-containing protein [Rhodospirillaceae bacterium]